MLYIHLPFLKYKIKGKFIFHNYTDFIYCFILSLESTIPMLLFVICMEFFKPSFTIKQLAPVSVSLSLSLINTHIHTNTPTHIHTLKAHIVKSQFPLSLMPRENPESCCHQNFYCCHIQHFRSRSLHLLALSVFNLTSW